MIDIVYTSLIGYPAKNTGGPNRIIYDLIKNVSVKEYSREYYSYTYQNNYGTERNIIEPHKELSAKKQFAESLYYKYRFYRRLVTSPIYHKYYLHKVREVFEKYSRGKKCDIIHAHHPIALSYFKENKAKKILSIHSKGGFIYELTKNGEHREFIQSDYEALKKREIDAVKSADLLTFPSNAAKELFFEMNPIKYNNEKIRIIYNGVDIDFIESVQSNNEIFNRYLIPSSADIYILNVANHVEQKNIELLIKTLNVLRTKYKKNAILINVGQGSKTGELRALINRLGEEEHIRLLGSIPYHDVIKLMKSCNIFVLTSQNVIFDLVVIEALAAGMNVFVSDDGGNREIIKDGESGYLLNIKDEISVASQIMNREHIDLKNEAVRCAKIFSLVAMTNNYQKIYKELIPS